MKACIIIPARFASKRFPGKPLVELRGKDGSKTLIRRTWETACAVMDRADVFIATDDERIAEHARAFGGQVIMTSENCRNGTERCAEASLALEYDLIINLQGDAPLTPVWFIHALIDNMHGDEIATPVLKLDLETLERFRKDRARNLVGGTMAVFDQNHHALYFSKEVIPYGQAEGVDHYHHVGVYAYTPHALQLYAGWGETPCERAEGLEQLRFLEHGMKVRCVEVEARGRVFWELNNPVDVERIEREL